MAKRITIIQGNAKAMIYPEGFSLLPATESATYCLPLLIYVQGVDDPTAGNIVSHNNFPVAFSKAKSFLSAVPLINTRPPAVTIGPGDVEEPVIVAPCSCNSGSFPIGIFHSYSPVFKLIALSVPHGGFIACRPLVSVNSAYAVTLRYVVAVSISLFLSVSW